MCFTRDSFRQCKKDNKKKDDIKSKIVSAHQHKVETVFSLVFQFTICYFVN